MATPKEPGLHELRLELDRIDAAMQALLIERSEITDKVEQVKRRAGTAGSAFRPGREAEIMRMLAERHRGSYPFDGTENIWRVIIATSTYTQVPYQVHGDVSGGDAPMRDSVRFHFGFTVPFLPHPDASTVIEAVAARPSDLGVFPRSQSMETGAWWRKLHGGDRPKIIARLPFVERENHPSGIPVFVIARPLKEAAVRDEIVASVTVERWSPRIAQALGPLAARIEATVGIDSGLSLLVTHPGLVAAEAVIAALRNAGMEARYEEVGSHAAAFAADLRKAGDRGPASA
ncbi:MAG TPA: chorismate mutase [Beijerinckiaceae bacterium]|nr:chorismate mutase [Beijerinckiaceae bacterium]